jgi:periplasmic divalent cation tolerance protein
MTGGYDTHADTGAPAASKGGPMAYSTVITTVGDREQARRLAAEILSARLAACVQIVPIESFYAWKGELVEDTEVLLLIKTRDERYDDLERAIRSRHPYEIPEVVALRIERGLPEYLAWIDDVT